MCPFPRQSPNLAGGSVSIPFLAPKQALYYTAYEGIVIVSIPEHWRASLAKQEAVVIKVAG